MNETVSGWIRKSKGDYGVANRELNEAREPDYDAICFHSQQCIEKLMKAILINAGVIPARIHDLKILSDHISGVHEKWNWPDDELRFLTVCSVSFRYPGESAVLADAQKAFDICSTLRDELIKLLD